jgi:4-hydroxy-3-methylbut-2-enyl diphosphate reductase
MTNEKTIEKIQEYLSKVYHGKIEKIVKSGYIVDTADDYTSFLPFSEFKVGAFPVSDREKYIGKEIAYIILSKDPSRMNKVISTRETYKQIDKINSELEYDNLEVGDEVEGTVVNIVDFGYFLKLKYVTGLLHISQIKNESFCKGDKILMNVVNKKDGKINFSLGER